MEDILRRSKILKENTIEFLFMNSREDLLDFIPNKLTKNNTEIDEIISILAKSGRPVEIAYINSFISI